MEVLSPPPELPPGMMQREATGSQQGEETDALQDSSDAEPTSPKSMASDGPTSPQLDGPLSPIDEAAAVNDTGSVAGSTAPRRARSASKEPRSASKNQSQIARAVKSKHLKFLGSLQAKPAFASIERLVELAAGSDSLDPEIMQAVSDAILRICEDARGFLFLAQARAMQVLRARLNALEEAKKSSSEGKVRAHARTAARRMQDAAVTWLTEVDHVEFNEMPNLVVVVHYLGCENPDIAVAALATIERFALHRLENCLSLLRLTILRVVHQLLGVHRDPEIVRMIFALLFRLCDLPDRAAAPFVVAEKSLVLTVVESVRQAPMNMQIQFSGFRLLALWSRLREPDIQDAFVEADARGALDTLLMDLKTSRFPTVSSWISTIIDPRALEAIIPEEDLGGESESEIARSRPQTGDEQGDTVVDGSESPTAADQAREDQVATDQ